MPPPDHLHRLQCLEKYDDWVYHPELAYRRCGDDGLWVGRNPNETSPNGWTNYTPCFPPLVQSLFYKVYDDENDAQAKFSIALSTRRIELSGYSISCLTILASIAIFLSFSALRNKRTLIHINLLLATFFECFVRLLLYYDQEIARLYPYSKEGITNTPYLCEFFYVLLEYFQSVMFTWMLIEGLFLNKMVNDGAMRPSRTKIISYVIAGWGFPAITTSIWATLTAYQYKDQSSTCWYGYNFSPNYFWSQGPRWAIMGCNFILLIKIMQIVVNKLKTSTDSELQRVKKGVRAALVLLPLLGLTNMLNMIQIPVDANVSVFAAWCYITHFLRSFQGCFISIIYCFMNGEVRNVLAKKWEEITNYFNRDENPEALELRTTSMNRFRDRFFSRRRNGNRSMSSDCNATASTTNNVVSGAEVANNVENLFRQEPQDNDRRIQFAANPVVHVYNVNEREHSDEQKELKKDLKSGNEAHPLARYRVVKMSPQKSDLNFVEVHADAEPQLNDTDNAPQQRSDLNAPQASESVEPCAPKTSQRKLKSSQIDLHPNALYGLNNNSMRSEEKLPEPNKCQCVSENDCVGTAPN